MGKQIWKENYDPNDPFVQLEIMREKAEKEGAGVSHQYNVIFQALSYLELRKPESEN